MITRKTTAKTLIKNRYAVTMDWFPLIAFGYLIVVTIAEILTTIMVPTADATVYGFVQVQYILLLFLLCVHTAVKWGTADYPLLLMLTLVPLIRIISLSLPLATFPQMYWYLLTSIPIFVAAFMVLRQLHWSWRDMGINGRYLLWQIPLALSGFLIGYLEYLILKPEPLIKTVTWAHWLAAALILLISTGFLEELIFRQMMQKTAVKRLGNLSGIVYVAAIFAVLHIGYSSFTDVLFVFAVGLFFGWAVYKTGSIVGVTLAHGLANIALFLVFPIWVIGNTQLTFSIDLWQLLEQNAIWLLLLTIGFGFMRLLIIEPQILE